LISRIVQEAACPVIALLEVEDRDFIREAAKRGVFAYIADGDAHELESSLDIVLQRFAEFHNLEGAFGRRAVTERAKGILMERHGIGEQRAFELLRAQARSTGRKLVDVAEAVVEGHRLLPAQSRGELAGREDSEG
jgi:response regulator NasT